MPCRTAATASLRDDHPTSCSGRVSRVGLAIMPGAPQVKLCRRCGATKPVKDFYKSKANADGLDGRCKSCDALQCSERRRRKTRVAVRTPPACRPCRYFSASVHTRAVRHLCSILRFWNLEACPSLSTYACCKASVSQPAQAYRHAAVAPLTPLTSQQLLVLHALPAPAWMGCLVEHWGT